MDSVCVKGNMNPLLRNFVALVVSKRRAAALPEMAQQYAQLVAGSRDELVAYVTSAQAIEKDQIEALKTQLKNTFGKTIVVEAEQDSALLGGMIVKVGSQMIDGSLRTKLNSLKTTLSGS
jgi:F-type H+-transporting ATPase subunit delta